MQPSLAEFQGDDFFIQQFFTGCLAEMAYYVESAGEAVIIDPMRDHQQYIEFANSRKAKLIYILQTHFHADFVSGHFDLAKKTGAKVVFGPQAHSKNEIYVAQDGQELKVGKITIKVVHTPGHTPESSSFVMNKADGTPYCMFTGDTLFLGDVGRPDLAVSGTVTKEDLASWLYDSLRNKLMKYPDDTIVFPGHGAGSACGKNIGTGTFCTLGKQKATNYALQPMEKGEFVKILTNQIPAPPQYFFHDAGMNRNGYDPLEVILKNGMTPLKLDKFLLMAQEGNIIIDTRVPYTFLTGYIKGSYNINLVMNFASWVGQLIDAQSNIILVCEAGKEEESVIRLARIGFDSVHGYLEGGIDTYAKSGAAVCQNEVIECDDFVSKILPSQPFVIDVRGIKEFDTEYMEGSKNFPLNTLEQSLTKNPKLLPMDVPIYLNCQTGGRASTASSILQQYGVTNIINIKDGFDILKTKGISIIKQDH